MLCIYSNMSRKWITQIKDWKWDWKDDTLLQIIVIKIIFLHNENAKQKVQLATCNSLIYQFSYHTNSLILFLCGVLLTVAACSYASVWEN